MLSFQVFNLFLTKKRMIQVQDYFKQEIRFKEYVIVFLLTLLVFLAFSLLQLKKLKKLGRWAARKDIQKTCFSGSTMLYKNLRSFSITRNVWRLFQSRISFPLWLLHAHFCRLSFRNCKSCLSNCHDHPSFNSSLPSSHNMIFIYSKLH